MNLPFFIARRYLQKQKGTFSSFIVKLAILATALSVAVMILAVAVVMGFRSAITEKLYSFMGHVHVIRYNETRSNMFAFSEPVLLDNHLMSEISRLPHVKAVVPFAVRPVILQAKGRMEGLQLKGVDKNYRFLSGIKSTGGSIDYSDSSYAKQIILSEATANRLDVKIGDTVQLNFVQESGPRIRRMRIAGLYHSGMDEIDKYFGICDLRLLQRINNWEADRINGYQVDLDDAQYSDTVSNYIHYNLINAPLESYTTEENYSFIFDWLKLQEVNDSILLIIMAIVAIINMGAVLVILIVDRARLIGLLKALGMPFEGIRTIFLYIAGIIAGGGILLGNIIALVLCYLQLHYGIVELPENAYYMRYAPVKIVWWQIVTVDIVTLVLCVFCMWLPALYIRRVHPARVLQFK
jgi:lipoprotein-releasing system permease protein